MFVRAFFSLTIVYATLPLGAVLAQQSKVDNYQALLANFDGGAREQI
ncbi:MAG: hypothetical protein IID51_10895, partial [Proteobacteria bacterium]|nr:hypothetical protein [Pseudomonadota bacterium]